MIPYLEKELALGISYTTTNETKYLSHSLQDVETALVKENQESSKNEVSHTGVITYRALDKSFIRYTETKYIATPYGETKRTIETFSRGNLLYGRNYGKNRFAEATIEWLKGVGLFIEYPILTFLVKIALPVGYIFARAIVFLSQLSGWTNNYTYLRAKDVTHFIEMHSQEFFLEGGPLKAAISIIPQLIISALAIMLFPCCSFFNKINGNIERWVNGHTFDDIEEKTVNKRMKERFYIAPCQQPLGTINISPEEAPRQLTILDERISLSARRILFRGIHTGDHFGFRSSKPKIIVSH